MDQPMKELSRRSLVMKHDYAEIEISSLAHIRRDSGDHLDCTRLGKVTPGSIAAQLSPPDCRTVLPDLPTVKAVSDSQRRIPWAERQRRQAASGPRRTKRCCFRRQTLLFPNRRSHSRRNEPGEKR